jgi:hypothetical protein
VERRGRRGERRVGGDEVVHPTAADRCPLERGEELDVVRSSVETPFGRGAIPLIE